MKLILMTTPYFFVEEHQIINALFDEGLEILHLRNDTQNERRHRYAQHLAHKMERKGYTPQEAEDKMYERNYFGMMMVETGEADAFITGLYTR